MASPNPTSGLGYQDFFSTTTTASITSSDTTIPLTAAPTVTEGFLVLEPSSSTAREIIWYNGVSGNNITLASAATGRGQGGTTAASHASGAAVQMNTVGDMFKALQSGRSDATIMLDTNGNNWLGKGATASAVNYLQNTNAIAASSPSLGSAGSDTNIDLTLTPKGTGTVKTSPVNRMDWSSLALGSVVQVVNTTSTTSTTGTTIVPLDNTIPQSSEGDQYMTLSITPLATSNILIIHVTALISINIINTMIGALFQDATASALAVGTKRSETADRAVTFELTHAMAAGTTSSTTFKFRAGPAAAGTMTFNGQAGASLFSTAIKSTMVIYEYKA